VKRRRLLIIFLRTVLSVHNYYRQPGGEDWVFEAEAAMLERRGHVVVRHEDRNGRIRTGVISAFSAIWNAGSYRRLRALARAHRPNIAHLHNTFPLISPSALYAMRAERVPIVQELQNFRTLCPGATLFRNGQVCEECIEHRSFVPAVIHQCYRDSTAGTAAVAAMLTVHNATRTWHRMVDVYVAPSDFVRRKFIQSGFPPERITVKPNPVLADPGTGEGRAGYALFVGRLSEEKGIRTLREAWQSLPDIPLLIAGDGPLNSFSWPRNVTRLGNQPRERVTTLMKEAKVLIVPSVWYETGPLTVLEAFACGLPVIASDLGSITERVDNHRTGLLFRPGDAGDLAQKVLWAFDHPEELHAMRAAARREFEDKYTAESNYKMLMDIYGLAIENARRRQRAAS